MSPSAAVCRCFVSVDDRQLHYRRAGEGPPVVLLHGSPRSSLALIDLISLLAERFCVVALDTPGYGSSDPLAVAQPAIADYADAVAAAVEALGIARFGVYGMQSGASIAVELVRRHPNRVAAAVLDGLPLFTAPERTDLLAHCFPPLEPHIDGSHLVSLWANYRDEFVFLPWYRQEMSTRRDVHMPSAESLHEGVLDVLRAGSAYSAASEAAIRHDAARPLAELAIPVTILARDGDPFVKQRERLPDLGPSVSVEPISDEPAAWTARIGDFLAEHAGETATPPPTPPAKEIAGRITKDYANTSYGQLLVRRAGQGNGPPLVMLHASPGSAEMLIPLIGHLATGRRVIALDTLGNGDSDKPPWHGAEIGDYAPVIAEAVDALGLEEIDLYGTHTGALIAIETSLLRPERVRRLVLDGVAMFTADERDDLLAHYTPALQPRDDGTHLIFAWNFLRDQTLYWPWYNRTREGIRAVEPMGAKELQVWLVELLKSGRTYPIGYRAAFRHATRERLPRLATPALMGARASDGLHATTFEAAKLAQSASAVTFPEADEAAIGRLLSDFLDR